MENENLKIGIIADEGGDLPKDLIKKHQISLVPFKVDLGEMKDLSGNIYQKIREAEKKGLKSFIKTSQPSPGDFLTTFKEKLKSFSKIICITVTSKHSGTFNSAIQAKNFLKERENIEIIDSLSISGGEGLIILKGVNLIENNLSFQKIKTKIKEAVKKTNLVFMLQDPKWAENSGRVPKIFGIFLRKMQGLGFFPLLGLKKGKIKIVGVKKKVKNIAEALFEEFKGKISKIEYQKINAVITHGDNEKEAISLANMISKVKRCEIKFINVIGEIVGGLAGPGALALAWQYDD